MKHKYLAMGMAADNGLFTWSCGVNTNDPVEVCLLLRISATGGNGLGTVPEQILLLENGTDNDAPKVVAHWNEGDDYIGIATKQ